MIRCVGVIVTVMLLVVASRAEDVPAPELTLGEKMSLFQATQLGGAGKWSEALPIIEQVLATARPRLGPKHPQLTMLLLGLGTARASAQQTEGARTAFRDAIANEEARLGSGHADVLAALQNVARMVELLGDYVFATEIYRRVVKLHEVHGPAVAELADPLGQLGESLRNQGKWTESELVLRRAIAIAERTEPEGKTHALALHRLGLVRGALGDYREAVKLHRRTLPLLERYGGACSSLISLGEDYTNLGEYHQAEPFLTRAVGEVCLPPPPGDVVAKAGAVYERIGALNALAALHAYKGDCTRSEPLAREALAYAERVAGKTHPWILLPLDTLGYCQGRSDPAAAASTVRREIEILERINGDDAKLVTLWTNLGLLLHDMGDLKQTEKVLQTAIATADKLLPEGHPERARVLVGIAELARHTGDVSRALKLAERGVAMLQRTYGTTHPDMSAALDVLAAILEQRGEITRAIETRGRGLVAQERELTLLLATGNHKQKGAFASRFEAARQGAVALHVQLAERDPNAARLAINSILQTKGRVLDTISGTADALRRGLDKDGLRLLDDLVAARRELAQVVFAEQPRRELIAAAETKLQALEELASKSTASLRASLRPATFEQVQRAIPRGAVLVEITTFTPWNRTAARALAGAGPARYVAYVVEPTGLPRVVDLGEVATIDAAVKRLRGEFATPASIPSARARARELFDLLLGPLAPMLQRTDLVILAPDGALNLVPFGALLDRDGRYAIETRAFHYVGSGRDLLREPIEPASGAVVVANPAFGAGGPRGGDADHCLADLRGPWAQLEGTEREGEVVARLTRAGSVLTGAGATKQAVTALHGPTILHIATHGFFLSSGTPTGERSGTRALKRVDDQRPRTCQEDPLLRSGLVFAGANRGDIGATILTAQEASGLDLRGTKLVVLSACETGVGDVQNGEGVFGLRRALTAAGAEAQVMSLWSVDDDATAVLMSKLYEGILGSRGRADALRRAQLDVMKTHPHPHFWAAFISSGAWQPIGHGSGGASVRSRRGCGCTSSPDETSAVWILGVVMMLRRRSRTRAGGR